jgi:Lamin Tail Domain
MRGHKVTTGFIAAAVLLWLATLPTLSGVTAAQNSGSRYFPETSHTVKGDFWKYWQEHGGLPQQGYPLSEEFAEISDLNGQTYTVQYFERAVFEKHPEFPPPNDVLLSQLGTFQYKAKYGDAGAPNQQPHTQDGVPFPETGYYVGGLFLDYWKTHGGLAQQGYPISNEFTEISDLNGQPYTVQYFERAVFELHPENPSPHNVLLSQLGTFQLKKKYPNGPPGGLGQPEPTAPPVTQPTPAPPPAQSTRTPTGTNCRPVDPARKSTINSTGNVAITNVEYAGDEYVEITDRGGSSADLSGWVLRDKNDTGQSFTFPPGMQLPAGGKVQVYTSPGQPYTFNSNSPIWNNCGDALELLDAGGTVVATYAYGTHLGP